MIKVLAGDPYLCMKALAPLICDIDSYSYRESTQFSDQEVMFLCGMPLFGTNTLLYKTDCIDANDTLLSFWKVMPTATCISSPEKSRKVVNYLISLLHLM